MQSKSIVKEAIPQLPDTLDNPRRLVYSVVQSVRILFLLFNRRVIVLSLHLDIILIE